MIYLIFLKIITFLLFTFLGMVIIISFICLFSKQFRDFFNNKIYNPLNKSGLKEIIFVITFLLTIASIFFGITTYYGEVEIQKENNEIILSNLITEIKINIQFIDHFESNKQKFIETDMFSQDKFQTFYLEKSADIVKDKSVREIIIPTIVDMKVINSLLKDFSEIYIPQGELGDSVYTKLKIETINIVSDTNQKIKSRLLAIQEGVSKK